MYLRSLLSGGEGFQAGTQRIMAAHSCFTYASPQIDETAGCNPSIKSFATSELIAAVATTSAKIIFGCKTHVNEQQLHQ